MRRLKRVIVVFSVVVIGAFSTLVIKRPNLFRSYEIGEAMDSLNHVVVYYNGSTGNIQERNVAADGYNIGLRYQCVEFVKRYYYEWYHHKMPNSYGNAVDFFNSTLKDGEMNADRALVQYTNPSAKKPKVGDLFVYSGSLGHVAIVSEVRDDEVQIIQQNGGIGAPTRVWYDLNQDQGAYFVENDRILGWLRMP